MNMFRGPYKKHRSRDLHLAFGTIDRYNVRSRLFVGESDSGVGLRFDVVNEDALLPQQCAMITAGNRHSLDDKVLVL